MYEESKPQKVTKEIEEIKKDDSVTIPPKYIKNRSLKSNKNYRQLRKDAKNLNLFNDVVLQLQKEVYNDNIYPIKDYQFDSDIVVDVMQIVERVFNEPKQGELKLKCVCEVLKPYFLGNIELINKFVDLNFHRVIKSNIVRRYGIKLFDLACNFFLGISETK